MLMSDITKQQAVQMTNNKLQSTIDNLNSQDLQPQIHNPQSAIRNPDIAISVRNLSKKYQLYETPKHRLKEALHPFKKIFQTACIIMTGFFRNIWNIKKIIFNVCTGNILYIGIIKIFLGNLDMSLFFLKAL